MGLFLWASALGMEPTDAFRNKIRGADVIVIAKPLEIVQVERIEYEPSDFKFKSAVYDCKVRESGLEEFIPPHQGQSAGAKMKRKSEWVCCAVQDKIAIVEDGANVTENTTSVSDCKTVASPSSYLTGRFPKVYEVTLNGKKINEEQYMKFHSERLKKQGRAKYEKKKVTVEVERAIKGDPGQKKISFEYEQGVRGDDERRINTAHYFRERKNAERVLFLRRADNGLYTMVIPQAESSPSDVPIEEGMVFVDADMQEEGGSTAFQEGFNSPRASRRRGLRETKKLGVDDYIAAIQKVMETER